MAGPEAFREKSGTHEYHPSPEQLARLDLLGQMTAALDAAAVRYTITGGYGLDGLYGALTRDHDDIDLLVDDEPGHIDRARQCLENLGCVRSRTKKTGVEVFTHLPTGTVVEMSTWAIPAAYTRTHEALFFPEFHNAHIGAYSFTTMTLGGHDIYADTQRQRALEGGWGRYTKRAHADWLVGELAKREERGEYPVS